MALSLDKPATRATESAAKPAESPMPDIDSDEFPIEIEDIGSNPDPRRPIGELIAERLSRRDVLGAAGAAALVAALPAAAQDSGNTPNGGPSSLAFPELRPQLAQRDAVAEGHEIQVLIRWGDPILPEAPEHDPARLTAAAQARQFGYNNDYLDFFPLPQGSGSSDRGLLVVNHEYTNTNLMFPGMGTGAQARRNLTAEHAAVERTVD
jgi:secreted PhoX family phosphatase